MPVTPWDGIHAGDFTYRWYLPYRNQHKLPHSTQFVENLYTRFECCFGVAWRVEFEDGAVFQAKPGEVFFIPPRRRFRLSAEPVEGIDVMRTLWGILRVDWHGKDILDGARGGPGLSAESSRRCLAIMEEAITIDKREGVEFAVLNQVHGMGLLHEVLPLCAPAPIVLNKDEQRLRPVLLYIEKHYTRELDTAKLAALINVSKPRFHGLFKSAMGMSPWKYVIHRRLKEAQELLLHSNLSMEAIALQCGFESGYYFSRIFRKHVGSTPVELPQGPGLIFMGIFRC